MKYSLKTLLFSITLVAVAIGSFRYGRLYTEFRSNIELEELKGEVWVRWNGEDLWVPMTVTTSHIASWGPGAPNGNDFYIEQLPNGSSRLHHIERRVYLLEAERPAKPTPPNVPPFPPNILVLMAEGKNVRPKGADYILELALWATGKLDYSIPDESNPAEIH